MLHIGLRQFVKVPIALNADKNTTENADPCVSQSRRPPLKQILQAALPALAIRSERNGQLVTAAASRRGFPRVEVSDPKRTAGHVRVRFRREHTSERSLITTTVGSGITVQKFAPIPPFRHAYAMVVSHYRREVSNYRNDLVVATAQETEHAQSASLASTHWKVPGSNSRS